MTKDEIMRLADEHAYAMADYVAKSISGALTTKHLERRNEARAALAEAFDAALPLPDNPMRKAERDIALLRAALVGLIGADSKEELQQMEVTMRLLPAPEEDKAVSINAIHALLATLPGNAYSAGREALANAEPMEIDMKAKHCDECKHFNDEDVPGARVCEKNHKPRRYTQKNDNPHDTDFGHKRKCGDYEGRKMVAVTRQMIGAAHDVMLARGDAAMAAQKGTA